MTETSNPKLTLESLNTIRGKIENNIATVDDFATLDFFISSILSIQGYILNKLKLAGVFSYEQYIAERKNTLPERHKLINVILYGYILGVISYLDDYLKTLTDK